MQKKCKNDIKHWPLFSDILCLIVMESWINYSNLKDIHLKTTPTERKHDGADIRNKERVWKEELSCCYLTGVITLMPRNLMHGKRKMLFGKSSMRKLHVKAKLLIKYEQCLAMNPSGLIPPGIMDACGRFGGWLCLRKTWFSYYTAYDLLHKYSIQAYPIYFG